MDKHTAERLSMEMRTLQTQQLRILFDAHISYLENQKYEEASYCVDELSRGLEVQFHMLADLDSTKKAEEMEKHSPGVNDNETTEEEFRAIAKELWGWTTPEERHGLIAQKVRSDLHEKLAPVQERLRDVVQRSLLEAIEHSFTRHGVLGDFDG